MLTHEDLMAAVKGVESKVDANLVAIAKLDKDLAVHKVKTSRFSILLSVFSSLFVTIMALFAKGCM